MLAAERSALILRILERDRFAAVGAIADLAVSSEATIRRDLDRLEREGLVRRVRGGAERTRAVEEPGAAAAREPNTAAREPSTAARELSTAAGQLPFDERLGILSEKKRRIAAAAAALCTDDDTVMIDGGSTTYPMAEFLLPLKLRVITNSFAIAGRLLAGAGAGDYGPRAEDGRPRAEYGRWAGTLILTGGVVSPDSLLVLDPFAEEPFGNYGASKAFMGVYGIDETGATNTEALLIKAERSMIGRAREVVILADSSKFGRRGSLFLCGFDRISTVITDDAVSASARQTLAERGVLLIVA